ncbi:DUF5698 domain-containing protein [Clostridium hydrogeniformans]|uniref:DUF5698 domain-containing protein n=1 Tax=Clostridium hydrogeniformans TaxID=349933 RepID=UPI0004834157
MLSYFAIFFAKVLEVSLATVRMVLITRGEKFWGSLIGFAEVVIWLYLIGSIISNVIEDPIKVVFYSLGFSLGNYVGAIIEERLALGLITLNIIASREQGDAIAAMLREKQVGVTTIDGEGKIEHKKMLIVHLKRKRKNEIVSLIEESSYNCVVSINDTKVVYGGYGLRK